MLIPFGILSAAGAFVIIPTAGYFAGGFTTAPVSTVDKFSFPDDTRATLATGLSTARQRSAGMANSGVAGYFGGGSNADNVSADVATVNKFAFADDSRTVLATGLSEGKRDLAAMSNSGVAGYFGGGLDSVAIVVFTKVDKFAFPADTKSTLGTGLSTARDTHGGLSNSGVAGYFGGGETTGNVNLASVEKFAFPGDSRSTLGTGLSAARRQIAAMANSGVAGYFAGGLTTVSVSTVDKFAFPGDSRSTLGTGLSANIRLLAGMANSGIAGYFGGGFTTVAVDTVDKFAFPSDTRSTLGTGLSSSRSGVAAMASEVVS
jgi:nitrogen regulatory protein PII-like uncharacterized protein